MKSNSIWMAVVVCAFWLPLAASAAGDPWVGTWQKHGKNGAPDIMLKITPLAGGGYTFVKKEGDAPTDMTVAVVPDGHPHSVKSAMGVMTSTCHRLDARTIGCTLAMAGMTSDAKYGVSADGKDLADSETDSEPAGQPAAKPYTDNEVFHKQ